MLPFSTLPWLLGQAAPAAAAPEAGSHTMLINLLLAVGVTAGSFALGSFLAQRLRMRDYGFKIGLVLFTLFASLAVNFMGWPPKRGIDLSGGVVLIYEVDRGLSQPGYMQTAIARINEQLNAGGGEKLEATPISSEQIEITVPEGVELSRVDKAVEDLRTGADLTLRSVGKRKETGKTVLVYNLEQRASKTVDMNKLIAAVGRRINPSGVKELTIRQYGAEQIEVIIPEIEEREVDQIKQKISTSGLLEFRIVANPNDDRELIKVATKTPGRDVYIGGKLEGRWVKAGPDLEVPGATMREVKGRGREILVRIDPYDVDGRYLDRASPDFAEGRMAVAFSFDNIGAEKFGELTRHNLPDTTIEFYRHLGIVLDDTMLSAPRINDTIRGRGVITGQFTEQYVDFLVGVLNAGSLPASLRPEPISQQRISSQLGDDTIQKGTMSIVISTAAILIFMAVYYRFCGLVADIAVMLNMIVTVALMILIKAAFTLPGLAGFVLTVGMAVDANVLIYERMREETERGASLRMAIRNGFGRAMATIIDSHVTTLVSAAVLYVVGTDQIKGFAVTLIIGLLMSLFTAVFVARVIFDIAEKQRWLTKLNLMHVIGHTNIDFIRWRGPAIAASVAVIVIGLAATWTRGKGILDIDFTGGSSVQIVFVEPQDIANVRKTVEAKLEDVAVSSVGEENLEFKVDTSNRDIKEVQQFLQESFGKSLRTYSMSFGQLATIEKGAAKDEKEEKGPDLSKPNAPADEKPAAEGAKPEEPKSEPAPETKPADDAKPAEPTEPKKPEGAQTGDRQAKFRLVSTAASQALTVLALAQAEPADKAATVAESKPATEETKPAAEEAKPTTEDSEPAAEAAPADSKPAETKSATDEPGDAAVEAAPPEDNTAMLGGTRATLSFPQEISYGPLHEMVEKELKELKFEGRPPGTAQSGLSVRQRCPLQGMDA